MLIYLAFLIFVKSSLAGRAVYLGGDIDHYAEISKKSQLYPKSNRPVTAKQLEAYRKYQSKFSDIAKAYAEGYKAAIQAVQARAVIAQKRLRTYKKKSNIPQQDTKINNGLPENLNLEDFRNLSPNFATVRGSEKSAIPHPRVSKRSVEDKPKVDPFHHGTPSYLLSPEKKAEIARMNTAASRRNVYMDNMGGVSYGGIGGVLSRQAWRYKKKHRRSVNDVDADTYEPKHIVRHRRSRMPYLGQNLDRLGVVRVKPNWNILADKKGILPKIMTPQTTGQLLPKKSRTPPVPQNRNANAFNRHKIPQMPWARRDNYPMNLYAQGQMSFQNTYGRFMLPQMDPVQSDNSKQQSILA